MRALSLMPHPRAENRLKAATANAPRAARKSPALALIFLLLASLVLAVYSPLMSAGYAGWDDWGDVQKNPWYHPPTWRTLAYYWSHPSGDLYAPVTRTVWAILALFAQPSGASAGLDPAIFHWANIFIHLATVCLVFGIVRFLLDDILAAAFGAALFAVHPVQVESVGWISGTKDLLATFFGLAAVWLYLIQARRQSRHHDSSLANFFLSWRYVAATVLFILALLSKPSAVAMPVVAVGLDLLALRRSIRRVLMCILPWFVPVIAAVVAGKAFQPAHIGAQAAPLALRPFVAGDALAFYLYKLVYPTRLAVLYGRTPAAVLWHPPYYAYWTWIFPVALALLTWMKRKRWPLLAGAGWVFVAALLPVLGLVQFDFQFKSTVADHYLYPAMLGPALALAVLTHSVKQRAVYCSAAAAIIALGVCSFAQAQTWTSPLTLYTNAELIDPHGWIPHDMLAILAEERRDLDTAQREALLAIRYGPDQPAEYNILGEVEEDLGNTSNAIAAYEDGIRHCPGDPAAYTNLAGLYGRTGDPQKAIGLYERALQISPSLPAAQRGLGIAEAAVRRQTAP